jgi:thiol:disulfide interchange protein
MRIVLAVTCLIALIGAAVLAALGAWLVYVDDRYFDDGPSLRAVGIVLLVIAAVVGVPSFRYLRSLWQQRLS